MSPARLESTRNQEIDMARLEWFCWIPTPFRNDGEFEEEAFRVWLRRFIQNDIGLYHGSGGGGESHPLTWHELQRIYETGVAECKGKIPIYANPPEQYTARAPRQYIRQAVECGVDLVSIYGLSTRHGMKPTDYELRLYFKEVLSDLE